MAKKPESRLQRKIREALEREFGGKWFKVWGGMFQETGISDLIGCVDGIFIALEVKRPGYEDTATDEQIEFIRRIKFEGGISAIVSSVDEAIEVVRLGLARRSAKRRGTMVPEGKDRRSVLRTASGKDRSSRRGNRKAMG